MSLLIMSTSLFRPSLKRRLMGYAFGAALWVLVFYYSIFPFKL